ncbi:MAG TPA: hypothetical protein VLR26_00355 [Frankiaceae bacterium]|nr:hypothetical protein [Frankiaceae bacterium]
MAVQQARKFAQTPRGQQFIAQAKQAATDPQTRAQLINQLKARTGRGGASSGQPGAADPYPPSTRPLSSPSVASPGPATSSSPSSATIDMPQVGSIPPPPAMPSDPARMPPA